MCACMHLRTCTPKSCPVLSLQHHFSRCWHQIWSRMGGTRIQPDHNGQGGSRNRAKWFEGCKKGYGILSGGESDAVRAPCQYLAQPGLWPLLTCQVQGVHTQYPYALLEPWPRSDPPPVSSARMHANIGRRARAVGIPPPQGCSRLGDRNPNPNRFTINASPPRTQVR